MLSFINLIVMAHRANLAMAVALGVCGGYYVWEPLAKANYQRMVLEQQMEKKMKEEMEEGVVRGGDDGGVVGGGGVREGKLERSGDGDG